MSCRFIYITSSRSTGSLNISFVSFAWMKSKTLPKLASKGFSCILMHFSDTLIYSNLIFSLFLTNSHSNRALSRSCLKHCQYFSWRHNSNVSTLLVFESLVPPWALCSLLNNGTPFLNCLFNVQYAMSLCMNWDFLAMVTNEPISWIRSGGIVGISMIGAEVRFFANFLRAWIIFLRESSFFASSVILLRILALISKLEKNSSNQK